ncbi:MAG: GtrA family protein [Dysgonamonadaceae bacterium]|jgi:putative flippase GtrA|nr:GtrA family protein [Dysgonamonadaceae bacterium]
MASRIKEFTQSFSKKGGIFTFLRAQASSLSSSLTDYIVSIVLAFLFLRMFGENIYVNFAGRVFKMPHYVIPNFIGSIVGGTVNCVVNYRWTFKASNIKKRFILIKYLLTWIGSILLNNFGTIALTETLGKIHWLPKFLGHLYDYLFVLSKLLVSLLVGFIWNYNMQRLFVYRNHDFRKLFMPKKYKEMQKKSLTLGQNSQANTDIEK